MTHSVLITGSMGYLGGRIACALFEHPGFELYLGRLPSEIASPKWIQKGKILQLDVTSEEDLTAACQGIQSIIHLAALNEIESASNPEQALMVNTLGTLKLLRAAEKAGVKKIIYFSTVHIYRAPLVGIITEKTVLRPTHPYAITHQAAEDFVLAAHDKNILCGIVLRLSNSFGTPTHTEINRWTLIVNDLCRQIVTSKKILLQSSGLQVRDFITIEDVTRVVLHFLRLPSSECGDGLFNVGGENPMRIIDMAELIASRCAKLFGFTPEIVKPKPKQNEISETLDYQIDKLKSTGFELKSDINSEIDNTLKFCQSNFGDSSKITRQLQEL